MRNVPALSPRAARSHTLMRHIPPACARMRGGPARSYRRRHRRLRRAAALRSDRPPLTAHVIPLAVDQAVSIFDFDQPAAAVFVIDPAANLGRQIKHFATIRPYYSRTRVFEEIIRGKGLSAAAEQLKIGKATAHTHAIRIFAKTRTEGQAHLLRRFFEMSLPVLRARLKQDCFQGRSIRLGGRDRHPSGLCRRRRDRGGLYHRGREMRARLSRAFSARARQRGRASRPDLSHLTSLFGIFMSVS